MQRFYATVEKVYVRFFMAKPYSFSTKRIGGNIYVQFALPGGGRTYQKSTGTTNRNDAEKIAMEWLVNGNIPERINSVKKAESRASIDKLGLFNNLRTYDLDERDIKKIIQIMKDRKFIVSAICPKTKESMLIDEFLPKFWTYEISPYRKSMLAQGKNLSMSYFATSYSRVLQYWLPALKGKALGEITRDDIKAVIASNAVQKLASKTINGIIDAITIALRWAFNEGYIDYCNVEGLRRKTVKSKKRKILDMNFAEKLFNPEYWDNDTARLANKVAMHTGMRTSEVSALRVKDIYAEGIHVGNSWCKYMGLKSCKNGEERDIPIPISKELREELLIQAQLNPLYNGETSFIFFGLDPSKPSCPKQWNKYLKRALKKAGYPKPEEITFYSWRHFFISRMLDVIQDKRIVMALSGHKTTAMLDHYGKHLEQKKTFTIAKKAVAEVFKAE